MRPYPIGNGTLEPNVPREFAALMDALQLQGANTDALLQLERRDWEKLLGLCDLAHLTLALAQIPERDFPTWVIRRLERNNTDNALRYERVRATYAEVAEALHGAGVPHLVIKGFTQAPDYVKDPRYRMQSDLDFYCLPGDLSKAQEILQKIGYKPVDGVDYRAADHVPTLSRLGSWKWRGNMFDPEMPPSIELHYCLWNENRTLIRIPDFESFWARRVTRTIDDFSFPALSTFDHLGFFALHIVRGIIFGDWIVHHVRELAEFLDRHADDSLFWMEWQVQHSPHLRSLEAIAFWLAETWFSCRLDSVARYEVQSMPRGRTEWLERFGGSALEVMFRRNKDGRLLQLLLLESWHERREVLRRAIVSKSLIELVRPASHLRQAQDVPSINSQYHLSYLADLGDRVASNLYANTRLLSHGACLWLSRRPMRTH
jgi:hypothetical protein